MDGEPVKWTEADLKEAWRKMMDRWALQNHPDMESRMQALTPAEQAAWDAKEAGR